MALVPITKNEFSGKRWRRFQGYQFAASLQVVPLAASELSHACGSLPLAFVKNDTGYHLMALMGLPGGPNLFVGPSGQWLGRYVPAALRGYPFQIAVTAGEAERWSVLFEDSSGLLAAADEPGAEAFLDEQDRPTPALRAVADFLIARHRGYELMREAVKALALAGVIEAWPASIKSDANTLSLPGLFRVSMRALDALPDDAFLNLRRAGALPLAMLQGASPDGLAMLGDLLKLQAGVRTGTRPAPDAANLPPGVKGLNLSIEDGQFKFD